MADTLVIRLAKEDTAPVSWVMVDGAGAVTGSVGHGPLSDATALAFGHRVIAVAPGIDVMLAEPELPVRGGARLAQVVPFALEEQLADDLEDLHFAVGRRENDRPGTPVAVIAKSRMDAWLGALRDAQIEPQALYVDSALLPSNPAQTVLAIEEDRLYVRHPDSQPFVLQAEPLSAALELAGLYPPPATETAVAPETRHVMAYVSEEDWERHQETLDAARERLTTLNVQLLRAGVLPLFAQQALLQPPFNLMQGAYAPRSETGAGWRRWKVAAILLACLVGLNLLGQGVELWRLKQTERALDAYIEQTFRETMGEGSPANARRHMESRLAAVRGAGGQSGGILRMLSVTGAAVAQVPNTRLSALNYRNNILDLQVQAGDLGSLSRLESLASQDGLTAEIQSSSNNPSGVEGRVHIKGAQSQ